MPSQEAHTLEHRAQRKKWGRYLGDATLTAATSTPRHARRSASTSPVPASAARRQEPRQPRGDVAERWLPRLRYVVDGGSLRPSNVALRTRREARDSHPFPSFADRAARYRADRRQAGTLRRCESTARSSSAPLSAVACGGSAPPPAAPARAAASAGACRAPCRGGRSQGRRSHQVPVSETSSLSKTIRRTPSTMARRITLLP